MLLGAEDVGALEGQRLEIGADVDLLSGMTADSGLWLAFLAEAGLEVLVHLRGQDYLPTGVAMLYHVPPLRLPDHLLLHRLCL